MWLAEDAVDHGCRVLPQQEIVEDIARAQDEAIQDEVNRDVDEDNHVVAEAPTKLSEVRSTLDLVINYVAHTDILH